MAAVKPTTQPSTPPVPNQESIPPPSSGKEGVKTEPTSRTPPPSHSSDSLSSSSSSSVSSNSFNLNSPLDANKSITEAFNAQLTGMVSESTADLVERFSDNQSVEQKELSKQVEQRSAAEIDHQQGQTKVAEKTFRMKAQEAEFFKRQMLDAILNKQNQTERSEKNYIEKKTQEKAKLQTYRLRSEMAPGLLKEGGEEQLRFKHQLPPGYQAFMQGGPRGKTLYIYSDQLLRGQELAEEAVLEGEEKELEGQAQKTAQGALAAGKKFTKQLGEKNLEDQIEEAETSEEKEAGEVGDEKDLESNPLRKAIGTKAAKTKGKGEEGEDDLLEHPWQNFGEAIERHTVLFVDADHAESAELVSQANFAGAIIMGAAIHIRLKGVRLDYSGTSHHGLPIPRGDEALEIGRDQVIAGFERDMGQMGVESVFVNGQRFELANIDDERKLKSLIKDNPQLYKMIEDIREAIRESRYYRTCLGLREEGPGGRA